MPQFPNNHVFILPHADEYRRFYDVNVTQVLQALNDPDLRQGLAQDHYTVEKSFAGQHIYVYYYLTLPLHGDQDETYAIVDFVARIEEKDQPTQKKRQQVKQ